MHGFVMILEGLKDLEKMVNSERGRQMGFLERE
jgi:hypothetical protein